MLELIRSRAKGWFAWIIVGLITIPFALWGVHQYIGGGGDTSVAKVDGVEITQGQLQTAYLQQRQRLQEMFGGELPPMFSEEMLKGQVLQQLIEQQMLVQTAADIGMRISDQTLAATITGIEAFHEDGQFSNTRYRQLLSAQGMTPGLFEQRVRRDMLASQLTGTITQTAFVTEAEVDNYLRLQQQQRTIGYLTVPMGRFDSEVRVSEEEISAYYEQHSQDYMQPERVKVDYLELKLEELAAAFEIDEESLRERYEARKLNYRTPEQRKASHILIRLANDASQEEVAAAQKKAEELLARLRSGEAFAELAKAESDDPGSAKQGGDLGFFGKGVMDPAFEEATFALEKGQISEPVRSSFGFHLIMLEEIQGGETKSFDEVRASLKQEMQAERAEQQYYDMAEQLANLTYEHPESLLLAAEQLELPVKTSEYFSRDGGPGIASNPKVTAAAFDEEVLARGNNSQTLELDRNHMVVLRLNDHQPAMLRPLEEVRAGIVSRLESEKAEAQAKELAQAVLERVRAGEQPGDLAEALGIEWSEQQTIKRDSADVARSISSAVFAMPHPAEGEQGSKQLALPSGDQAIVILYRVEDGNPAEADDKARRQAQVKLQQAAARAAENALVEGIRSRMDITTRK
jgi:peptidyl-prolyl cis-trans isomerase D